MPCLLHTTRAPERRPRFCKTCVAGPLKQPIKVRQGPVDFYFCSVKCAEFWHEHRYDARLGPLFKLSKGERLAQRSSAPMPPF